MSTLRQYVSDIRSRHKLFSYDNMITDRVIASELRGIALLLIKRETNLRRFWNTDTLFTTLPCVPMQEVPLASCCSYNSDKVIARSKLPLPRVAEGNYQYIISGVFNIEGTKELKYIPVKRYINSLKLGSRINEVYFWIQDNYLYATDSRIKVLKVSAFFEEDIPYSILYPKCDCNSNYPPCINPLDMEFNLPGILGQNVKDMTSEILLKTYFRIPRDVTSDDKEGD